MLCRNLSSVVHQRSFQHRTKGISWLRAGCWAAIRRIILHRSGGGKFFLADLLRVSRLFWSHCATQVLPAGSGVFLNFDAPRFELDQQFKHPGRRSPLTGDHYSPFEVFTKLFIADLPFFECGGCGSPNLYKGKVARKRYRLWLVWPRTAQNKVVVAMDQYSNHFS
jgi:hypothetical protein